MLNKFLKKLVVASMLLGVGGLIETPNFSQPQVEAARRKNSKTAHRKAKKKTRSNKKAKKYNKNIQSRNLLKVDIKRTTSNAKRKILTQDNQIPEATYYIATNNDKDYQASLEAINAWNKTGVIKFREASNAEDAYVYIHNANYGDTSWAGEEITYTNRYNKDEHRSEIKINDFFTKKVSNYIAKAVIEHELGHAIGLMHIDGQPSVMNSIITPSSPVYTIQPVDINMVRHIYSEK